jgi:hypothetical protein
MFLMPQALLVRYNVLLFQVGTTKNILKNWPYPVKIMSILSARQN